MKDNTEYDKYIYIFGVIPIIWISLLIAPFLKGGIVEVINNLPQAFSNPLKIEFCNNSLKTVIVFLLIYFISIMIYESTKKNYRKREEHGSARWGNKKIINKKYMQYPKSENKILTQNVAIGLDGKKHRRNLNVLVCGGSGAGKTRFYR